MAGDNMMPRQLGPGLIPAEIYNSHRATSQKNIMRSGRGYTHSRSVAGTSLIVGPDTREDCPMNVHFEPEMDNKQHTGRWWMRVSPGAGVYAFTGGLNEFDRILVTHGGKDINQPPNQIQARSIVDPSHGIVYLKTVWEPEVDLTPGARPLFPCESAEVFSGVDIPQNTLAEQFIDLGTIVWDSIGGNQVPRYEPRRCGSLELVRPVIPGEPGSSASGSASGSGSSPGSGPPGSPGSSASGSGSGPTPEPPVIPPPPGPGYYVLCWPPPGSSGSSGSGSGSDPGSDDPGSSGSSGSGSGPVGCDGPHWLTVTFTWIGQYLVPVVNPADMCDPTAVDRLPGGDVMVWGGEYSPEDSD